MAQSGRSPISKVAELHVGHSAREVGNQTARGFTIPAAFLAFTRATSTSASNAKALPMRRFDEAIGFAKQADVRVGHARCLSHAVKHDAFGLDPFTTQFFIAFVVNTDQARFLRDSFQPSYQSVWRCRFKFIGRLLR